MNWYQQTIWHTIEFSNNRRSTSPFHQAREDQVLQPPQLTRPELRSSLVHRCAARSSYSLHPLFTTRPLRSDPPRPCSAGRSDLLDRAVQWLCRRRIIRIGDPAAAPHRFEPAGRSRRQRRTLHTPCAPRKPSGPFVLHPTGSPHPPAESGAHPQERAPA